MFLSPHLSQLIRDRKAQYCSSCCQRVGPQIGSPVCSNNLITLLILNPEGLKGICTTFTCHLQKRTGFNKSTKRSHPIGISLSLTCFLPMTDGAWTQVSRMTNIDSLSVHNISRKSEDWCTSDMDTPSFQNTANPPAVPTGSSRKQCEKLSLFWILIRTELWFFVSIKKIIWGFSWATRTLKARTVGGLPKP